MAHERVYQKGKNMQIGCISTQTCVYQRLGRIVHVFYMDWEKNKIYGVHKMQIFEKTWKRIEEIQCKSAFEFIATAMEELEKLDMPGEKKEELLMEFVQESTDGKHSVPEPMKSQLVQLKENEMIKPYVDTVCKVAKHLFKINKKKLFDGKWCNCLSLRK